jgi:esterase/lipase/NAD(P)-dependent dehydrogenase (short-subunit alcohol dehydrogenase family)/acyl carrier protein
VAQQLLKNKPLSFTLLTRQAFSLDSNDPINPQHTQALGFWKSFAQEAGGVPCYLIDSPDETGIDQLLGLIREGSLKESQVIMREKSFVPRLMTAEAYAKHHQLPAPETVVLDNLSPFACKLDATYLITGGAGGLGLALAEHLIGKGARHLVLTSRSKAPEALNQWMVERQGQGVDVTHYQADVADKKALKEVFDAIAASNYPLKGIFHAAGLIKDGLLATLGKKDFDAVLAPKVTGASNLHALSKNLPLDCMVLFSSVASLLGNAGQTNYAAANAFMDGLAIERQRQGLPALSINWGPFAKVGMATGLEAQHRAMGMIPLEVESAFETMDVWIGKSVAQIGLMQMDWSKVAASDVSYLSYLVTQGIKEQGDWWLLLKATPAVKQEEVLAHQIKSLLADVLNIAEIDSIDVNKEFFEMGMDSLMAVDLKNRLQLKLGYSISLTNMVAFNYPTVMALRDYLLQTLSLKEKTIAPAIQTSKNENFLADRGMTQVVNRPIDAMLSEESLKEQYQALGPKGYFIKNGNIGVLLIHGVSGTPGEMKSFGTALSNKGYTVAIPQLAGHCASFNVFKKSTRKDWAESVNRALIFLQKHCSIVFVGGLSTGAPMAIQAAVDSKEGVAGLMLLSSTLFTDGWNMPWYKRMVTKIIINTPLRYFAEFHESQPYGIKNEESRFNVEHIVQSFDKNVPSEFGNMIKPAVVVHEIYKMLNHTKKILPKVTCPVLLLHSTTDDMASLTNVNYIKTKIASNRVDIHYLDDSYHLITIDNQKELVKQYAINFIASVCKDNQPDL